ncbi:hypothetical protein BKA66DRAFT_446873 [Pyrenochaeta sp. MPI-SDFR-AT-0127]|nr:hypothetical protein BKA66DRAFT_446873 [Pyrenochaeta sp. MPI-SDFR-AT-0127]
MVAMKDEEALYQSIQTCTSSISSLNGVDVTRLATDPDVTSVVAGESRSTFHIYHKKESHKDILPVTDPSKERLSGPTFKEQKAKRKERKARKNSGLPVVVSNDSAFFLHTPYLAFHMPPRVLYSGKTKHATPVVLIHEGWFWKEYKLQLGPSIAQPGVLDPRGVVAWKHHGGDKQALQVDDRKLKGYKVRTWRLWGETGKAFVRSVKENRKAGVGVDPDALEDDDLELDRAAKADEVVYLRWISPLSRHTRSYYFHYGGIDFYWKGTGTINESRTCGFFLRFNHLKIVAKLPGIADAKGDNRPEICLGKYTSSVASKKSGTLELFDAAIVRLVNEYAPKMLAQAPSVELQDKADDETIKVSELKKSTLYKVILATGLCMVMSEKEKRQSVLSILSESGQGAGGAGG